LFQVLQEIVRVHHLSLRRRLSDGVRRVEESSFDHTRLSFSESRLCSAFVLAIERHGLTGKDVSESAFVTKLAVALCEPLTDWFTL
jgi:hypothetical protein